MKQQISTTPEQGKRLIACGIDPTTADMCWTQRTHRIDGSPIKKSHQKANLWLGYPCKRVLEDDEQRVDTPAWSTSAIMNVLPAHIDGALLTIQKIDERACLWQDEVTWGIAYMTCEYDSEGTLSTHSTGARKVVLTNDLITGLVDMLEWVISNHPDKIERP